VEQRAVSDLGLAHSWNPKLKSTKKLTPTIEHETNPVWNTGAFQFEVQSEMDTVKFEVKDLLGRDDMHEIFLGRVERRVSELVQKLSSKNSFHAEKGAIKSSTIEETLQGTGGRSHGGEQGVLGFQISFQKYEGTKLALTSGSAKERQQHQLQQYPQHQYQQPPSQTLPTSMSHGSHGHSSFGSQDLGNYIGVIKVEQIKAKDLFGHGMMDRLTHLGGSFAKAKLDTQIPQKAMRTDSQSGADPVWTGLNWKFNVGQEDQYLEIAIHNEGIMGDDTSIGRLIIPIMELFQTDFCRHPRPIEDVLRDKNEHATHGKLEVFLRPKVNEGMSGGYR